MLQRISPYSKFLVENSGFLIIGTLLGLVWANFDHASYEPIAHTLHFAVNEIGMALFFGIAAKEVFESLLPGGALASPRQAAMPLVATLGGILGPALFYVAGVILLQQPELMVGWAIPCATDIAFSYLVARTIFGATHPAIPFLLLLAIVDDGIGLIILAVVYPTGALNLLLLFGLVACAVLLALLLRRLRVINFWPYIALCGGLSWAGMYWGGIHPSLALVPVIFAMPHAKSDLGLFANESQALSDPLNQFEHWWATPVELILGLFGFVNAGVALGSIGAVTWLILFSLIIGKPFGIMLFAAIGHRFHLRLPEGMHWGDLLVVGCAAGIGFTVALFISTVAFVPGLILDQAKMGALLSFGAALVTFLVARVRRTPKTLPLPVTE